MFNVTPYLMCNNQPKASQQSTSPTEARKGGLTPRNIAHCFADTPPHHPAIVYQPSSGQDNITTREVNTWAHARKYT